MTQGMGMDAALWMEPGAFAEPVEDLDQVTPLQLTVPRICEEEVLRRSRASCCQVLFRGPGSGWRDKDHAVFASLAAANEQ